MSTLYNPKVTTDGLVLYLDAGNPRSYNTIGNSAYFDGTGDMLSVPPNTALDLTGDFTIEAWFNPSGTTGWILNKGGGLNIAWASYELLINGTTMYFAASSANNGYDIGGENANGIIGTFTANVWNHVAVTRSGNVYRGFVNGVQGYTQTLALTPYSATTRGLNIGASYQNAWGVAGNIYNGWTGYISNVRIIKGTALYTGNFTVPTSPLTAVANTSLLTCQDRTFIDNSTNNFVVTSSGNVTVDGHSPFNPTAWRDLIGNNSTATLTNGPIYNLKNNGSISFTGTTDYGVFDTTNFPSGNAPFAIEMVLKFKGAGSNIYSVPFGYGRDNGAAGCVLVYVDYALSPGRLALEFGSSAGLVTSSQAIVTNQWHHVVCQYTGTQTQIYVDGNLVGSRSYNTANVVLNNNVNGNSGALGAFFSTAGNITAAPRRYGTFKGDIAKTAVYNRSLSSAEILQNFNAIRNKFGV